MKNGTISIKGILEGISALAVVLSLIFVGLQMNENTKATRSATAAETQATISEWYNTIAGDIENTQVFLNFQQDPLSLSKVEQYQIMLFIHSYMLILQNTFYLEEEGTLDARIRESFSNTMIAGAGTKFYWEQRKPLFTNQRFVTFVDEALLGGSLQRTKAMFDKPNEE